MITLLSKYSLVLYNIVANYLLFIAIATLLYKYSPVATIPYSRFFEAINFHKFYKSAVILWKFYT